MERELSVMVGILENGYPYIETMDVQSGLTMKVSGEKCSSFPEAMEKVKEALWNEVSSWIYLMQDEQEDEQLC